MYYAVNKVIIVSAEEAEAQAEAQAEEQDLENKMTETVNEYSAWKMGLKSSDKSGVITILCDADYSEFDISNRPDLLLLTLTFPNATAEYFKNNPPAGDFENVSELYIKYTEKGAVIEMSLKDMLYPDITYSQGTISISWREYAEDNVIIVDPGYGGIHTGAMAGNISEKDINLKIARKVETLSKGKPYNVYLTRSGDDTLSTEERLELINLLYGDYYVGISLNADVEDVKAFGMSALYNGEYYRSGFENVDFADLVLRESAGATLNRANGLIRATENDVILMALEIPGTCLKAGTITNATEAELLSEDEYIEKIAKGIINALDSVVE